MRRRAFLAGAAMASLGLAQRGFTQQSVAVAVTQTDSVKAARRKAIETFPFQLVTVPTFRAQRGWEVLRKNKTGSWVVLGGEDDVVSFSDLMTAVADGGSTIKLRTPEEIIAAAGKLKHPEGLRKRALEEDRDLLKFYDEQIARPPPPLGDEHSTSGLDHAIAGGGLMDYRKERAELAASIATGKPSLPDVGEWPEEPEMMSDKLDLGYGVVGQTYIAKIPTTDWTTIPAYLQMGDWNECPAAEYHITAFRSWRDRFGVELAAATEDTVQLRVARPPKSRKDALTLAEEIYLYCPDTIEQDYADMSSLAAALMISKWWSIWWD